MVIFFANSGPMISYVDGMLQVDDLNPEAKIKFVMSRGERLRAAAKMFLSAVFYP
jgi:hypothetical protein